MNGLRTLIREHRMLAILLLVAAFSIKALLPAGFMVSASPTQTVAITICTGSADGPEILRLSLPAVDTHQAGQSDSGHSETGKQGDHCAFSGLAKVAMGGADAVLLALAFAYILVLGFQPLRRVPSGPVPHLRPPLRGPPVTA